MDNINQSLEQSLYSGFIDRHAIGKQSLVPELLVNNKLVGKKVLSTILNELQNCNSFWFSVAFVTTSGVAVIIDTLKELEKRGIHGKILVSQYLNFTQPEALKRLLTFSNIELKIDTENKFHSKGYLFIKSDICNLIIGSSNLTANALCTNTELNIKLSATPTSKVYSETEEEFRFHFDRAVTVNHKFVEAYESIYKQQIELNSSVSEKVESINEKLIQPNLMQVEALDNISLLRSQGKHKSLLISATGTGKTYLSAFDAKKVNPNRLLFVVHRNNIAQTALKSYRKIFGNERKLGMYSGGEREINADFLFSTVQTISREEHLKRFTPDHFDYIVIDETHRAGADTYQKILDYFRPKYLLGMTATPERTDGYDVFKLFDHNIAYEIRLHRAMAENMLSPFHYYGVSEIEVNGKMLDENSDFKILTSNERVKHIIEKAKFYGCDDGNIRGLIFCSLVSECYELSKELNKLGYRTVALSGDSSEEERTDAINRLESNDETVKLDYIFTVDIFNEGIDIPRVNQVIMLRPTQSAIIFVQQLGRGLRKADNKQYLTVIDFIGNYSNNFLVPIALFGDTTYNKDTLRKMMAAGSSVIPGSSTVNFDRIAKERIFAAIDSANMQRKKDLLNDYNLLKYKLGRIPSMVDFIEHGSRDPQHYVEYSGSYYNFVEEQEKELLNKIGKSTRLLLEHLSKEINNSKRIEESIILLNLIKKERINHKELNIIVKEKYGYMVNEKTFNSAIHNLNLKFVTENKNGSLKPLSEIYNYSIVHLSNQEVAISKEMKNQLNNLSFREYLTDSILSAILKYDKVFNKNHYVEGFVLYKKYSRKDVFRILNWEKNPLAQNVGGYMISEDESNCPIFVNYHKADDISESTKYEDGFINNEEFEWMSKSNRTLNSNDVKTIKNYKKGLRLPLFVKKSNDEGLEFYYMGDLTPVENSFVQKTLKSDSGKEVSVVKIKYKMNIPVEESIYNYITNN